MRLTAPPLYSDWTAYAVNSSQLVRRPNAPGRCAPVQCKQSKFIQWMSYYSMHRLCSSAVVQHRSTGARPPVRLDHCHFHKYFLDLCVCVGLTESRNTFRRHAVLWCQVWYDRRGLAGFRCCFHNSHVRSCVLGTFMQLCITTLHFDSLVLWLFQV